MTLLSSTVCAHCRLAQRCPCHTCSASLVVNVAKTYLGHKMPANRHDKLLLAAVRADIRQLVKSAISLQRSSLQVVEIDPLHQ